MRTTVAIVNEQGSDFSFEEVRARRPARRRGAGADRRDRAVPHRHRRCATSLPAEMFPRVFGHEGAGVVEEVGARRQRASTVGDHVVLSLRSCRACARCERRPGGLLRAARMMLNYMGMRMDGSTTLHPRRRARVYGSFFGQSSFARHAHRLRRQRASSSTQSLDLTQSAPYGCGFQTGAGAVLNVLRARPERQPGRVRRGRGRPRRDRGRGGRRASAPIIAVDLLAEPARRRPSAYGAIGGQPGRARRRLGSSTGSRS